MIRLLITGDYSMHNRMQQMRSSDIVTAMSSVVPYVKDADYAITNLESAVFDGEHEAIVKCGANLHSSSEAIKALKELGFRCVTLANNHFADYGDDAVEESLQLLKEYGIDYFGAGRNIEEAKQVRLIEIKGKKIAVINCCEHEYTIATDTKAGCNPLDVVDVSRAIRKAKKEADYTIVIVHGGSEHYALPTPRMQKWYRFFVEAGADAVINHHQHCYSGYEMYEGKPIVYGLGNFCFDWNGQRGDAWNKGYMVQLMLDKDLQIELIPYEQCDEKVGTYVLTDRKAFEKHIAELNQIISKPEEVQKQYDAFGEKKREEYLHVFNNPQNRMLRRLAKKGLLPKKFAAEVLPKTIVEDRDKLLTMLSYFQCESHTDVMTEVLKNLKGQL